MKTIRNLATLAGITLVLFALGATVAKAQQAPSLSTTLLGGSFNLPFEAHWGPMTLPAGGYSVYYGHNGSAGAYMVEVVAKAKGGPHGRILAQAFDTTAAPEDSIIFVRKENKECVWVLQLPTINVTVYFPLPHGNKATAQLRNRGTTTLLAEAPTLFQQIPIALNGK